MSGNIRFHHLVGILTLALLVLVPSAPGAAPDTNVLVVLTNAAQVRSLTPDEAARKVPVRLRGVIVESSHGNQFTMVDGTAGIYCEGNLAVVRRMQRGDLIEVEGNSDPGKFAPYVAAREARIIGRGEMPVAQPAKGDDLSSGRLDAQWVEVSGVVRRVDRTGGGYNLQLNLDPENIRVLVRVPTMSPVITVDSTISLRAVCFYQFNKARQTLRPFLSVPQGERVRILKPGLPDLDALPVRPIKNLMQFDSTQAFVNRVRVRGQVVFSQAGEGVWIHDAERGLRVFSDGRDLPAVGSGVDVFGFLKRGDYGPVIEDAVFRKSDLGIPITPVVLSDIRQAFDHDSDLVECDAVIVEQLRALDGVRLKLASGAVEFTAVLRMGTGMPPKDWQPGSRVRVMGVCTVGFLTEHTMVGTQEPQVFQILLRAPSDIQILQRPSWWTSGHVAWLLGAVIFMLLAVVVLLVVRSRRRLREQSLERMKAEAEFAAVWNERNRMAREIHDTLAQGLTAISMQLEVLKRHLPSETKARELLELARSLVREKMTEARNAIWNMRSQALENSDLAKALGDVLRDLTEGTPTRGEIRVRGGVCRLAPLAENNLLHLGREAITNAMKYARATTILVALDFEDKHLRLCISDDGCGFDVNAPPPSEGGFGLKAMRERAAQIHAEFSVTSVPGEGTIVTIVAPLAR
jgi:signal transduction histidine kinase